ncbi:MAG: phage holin family protein [Pseudomonadota bacterium]|nr:phage holin family protein [Pseudomonadota bacterium]
MTDAADAQSPPPPHDKSPPIEESLRQVRDAGRSVWAAGNDASKAFRVLLAADVSLARSAFGRTLALTGVAITFGASGWLLLMAALIVGMSRGLGVPWGVSMVICAVVSLIAAGVAAWYGQRYFEHTRMQATRRQLARLGVGELADFTPEAGDAVSTKEVTERELTTDADGKPLKDDLGVDVTPP